MFVVAAFGFAATSALIAIAPEMWVLLVGRVLQGFAAALLWTATIALVFGQLGPLRAGLAGAFLVGIAGLGQAFGPIDTGLVVERRLAGCICFRQHPARPARRPRDGAQSSIVDGRPFDWTVDRWPGIAPDALVLYELHVGTFTPEGTFAAAAERLERLARLGVTAIELMPVADFPGRWNWGYDGVALFAPSRCYGTPDDLRRLIDVHTGSASQCILDVVYNHLGPDGNYLSTFSPTTSRSITIRLGCGPESRSGTQP